MPLDPSIRRVVVVGSGPIVVGQGAEFDYAGTQALRALRADGVESVVVNSNPATVMVSPGIADRVVWADPTPEAVARAIRDSHADGLLASWGGQAGLRVAIELARELPSLGCRLLGTGADAIAWAEDRGAFKQIAEWADGETARSKQVDDTLDALGLAEAWGWPLVVRPAGTLGGLGSAVCWSWADLRAKLLRAFSLSPAKRALVEESLLGWTEIEYEIVRDSAGNAIAACGMENVDPVGVHTGDSIVVAPIQTLPDELQQRCRSLSLRIAGELGIVGACNVQLAVSPAGGRIVAIEANPRVSRSSALASKATGYPIAWIAARLALGWLLPELRTEVGTPACVEPAVAHVAAKAPAFSLACVPSATRDLSTQMRATGEALAFGETLAAAVSSAISVAGEQLTQKRGWKPDFAVLDVGRQRASGFAPVEPTAGELETVSPILRPSVGAGSKTPSLGDSPILVVGSGPIVVGQGVEFDCAAVEAVRALREAGHRVAVVNSNPETVSTDPAESDAVFLEAPTPARVAEIASQIGARVLAQFGGQAGVRVSRALGDQLAGTPRATVEACDDRAAFRQLCAASGTLLPASATVLSAADARAAWRAGGWSAAIVRPSSVIGGAGVSIARTLLELDDAVSSALERGSGSVVVDELVSGIELDVEVVCDGRAARAVGALEQLDPPGVHSGDSIAVYPPTLPAETLRLALEAAERTALGAGVVGVCNFQCIARDPSTIVAIELNPRASRTLPLLERMAGIDVAGPAALVAVGDAKLSDVEARFVPKPLAPWSVKLPVFSHARWPGSRLKLGPRMQSTGERLVPCADLSEVSRVVSEHRASVAELQRSLEENAS